METRTQYRAECSACGRDHAVDGGGRIADHGYKVEWHSRHGRCLGSNVQHFGTKEGRDYRASIAANIAEQSVKFAKSAADVESGLMVPNIYDWRTKKRIDDPAPWQIKQWVEAMKRKSQQYLDESHRMQRTVDEWKERFPREVEVEKKSGPLLHAYSARWGGGKLCASSAMGAQKGYTTKDDSQVTCKKCLDYIEKLRAAGKR